MIDLEVETLLKEGKEQDAIKRLAEELEQLKDDLGVGKVR